MNEDVVSSCALRCDTLALKMPEFCALYTNIEFIIAPIWGELLPSLFAHSVNLLSFQGSLYSCSLHMLSLL